MPARHTPATVRKIVLPDRIERILAALHDRSLQLFHRDKTEYLPSGQMVDDQGRLDVFGAALTPEELNSLVLKPGYNGHNIDTIPTLEMAGITDVEARFIQLLQDSIGDPELQGAAWEVPPSFSQADPDGPLELLYLCLVEVAKRAGVTLPENLCQPPAKNKRENVVSFPSVREQENAKLKTARKR